MTTPAAWYANPPARSWRSTPITDDVLGFHRTLPGYQETRTVDLPALAQELGVAKVFVKDESSRLGLPAFKILGAAYAVSRAVSARLGVTDRALPLDELRTRVASAVPVTLYAATDGNHGRAVARVARLIGLPAHIFFPATLTPEAKAAIAIEGATTTELDLPYDDVVDAAMNAAKTDGEDALLIQDTSWPGYEQVPQWIVDGYSTLFAEADAQLAGQGIDHVDLVVVPVGVGSLAQAAVRHYRAAAHPPVVLSVEAENAPAILESLQAGETLQVPTSFTIMSGLNCGTPSENAWPYLVSGLDAAITVSDTDAGRAVRDLQALDVDSGPCGAATLAGARKVLGDAERRAVLDLGERAVVLLVSTEGRAANPLPDEEGR